MKFKRSQFLTQSLVLLALGLFSNLLQAEPKVVVTINPIHSLVAGLKHNIGEPHLLLQSNQSPHNMSLRPSDARALGEADLIIWVGPTLETPLSHLLLNKRVDSKLITLLDTPELTLLATRNSLDWDSHKHHDPVEQEWDSHIWLSPYNARQMVLYLTDTLIQLDSSNSEQYHENSQRLLQRLDALEKDFSATVSDLKERPYIVFHDAYQYLEQHFMLNAVGSVSISPERQIGARHIHELRTKIHRLDARCVFTEPQFEPKLVHTLVDGTDTSIGELDPLGGNLPSGPDAYFLLIRGLGEGLAECLGGTQ